MTKAIQHSVKAVARANRKRKPVAVYLFCFLVALALVGAQF